MDYATLGWYPIEHTDIMPMSMLDADDLFTLVSDEMLRKIYFEPTKA